MKNKGFVLMETIVVIVVISIALLTIFSSYSKILSKVKAENKYDTSEYIYLTKYIKNYLKKTGCSLVANDIYDETNTNFITIKEHYFNNSCGIKDALKNSDIIVAKIYILTDINDFDNNIIGVKINNDETYTNVPMKNSQIFDAYMIDYIKKLNVRDNDQLIIVEYQRPAMNENYEQLHVYGDNNNKLHETYIASLEW